MAPSQPKATFLNHLARSLESNRFVRLRLSQPVDSSEAVQRVDFRLIELKGVVHLARVSHEARRDVTKNLPVEQGMDWIRQCLGTNYRSALLSTTGGDRQLHFPATGKPRLVSHKPGAKERPSRAHDRARKTVLGGAAQDWLQGLGILDEEARARASMADKQRQIERYTEILSHLARDCGWVATRPVNRLRIADMGCGKGYLTFAAWHLFHRVLQLDAEVVGVEARQDLVRRANALAERIPATGLRFITGSIATTRLSGLEALIALHACNTATDDAIQRGIELGARLIVVAPCCHQAIRPQLGSPEPFAELLRHGLFKERMAEWVTDGLRTLFLEWAGYKTKVIEFVASEHTPKNLMIAGVRKGRPFSDGNARARIVELKRFFGIKHHVLDSLLEEP